MKHNHSALLVADALHFSFSGTKMPYFFQREKMHLSGSEAPSVSS
jgi:hypothetical protein